MAETIISPGVFTRENDQSFLPKGIGAIGAAFIGPTQKGPAFVPQLIRNGFNEFIRHFGDQHPETYVPFAVKEYLRNAGVATVVRVLAGGGYKYGGTSRPIAYVVNENAASQEILAVLVPSKATGISAINLSGSTLLDSTDSGTATLGDASLVLKLDGGGFSSAKNISCSFVTSSNFYVKRTVGSNSANSKTGANSYDYVNGIPAHTYLLFEGVSGSSADNIKIVTGSNESYFTGSFSNSGFAEGYDHASTPFITSGYLDSSATTQQLFKFHTLADGTPTNRDYKISIKNLKLIPNIDNVEQYSTFTVEIRKWSDTDKSKSVLESFGGVNLDPNSPNFISRRIGDRYQEYSTDFGKVVTKGDYPNISEFVRVEVNQSVAEGSLSPKLLPKGFKTVYDTIQHPTEGGVQYKLPAFATASQQLIGGNYNSKGYLGWDFNNTDNINFNNPVPATAANGAGIQANKGNDFNVDALSMHSDASATWAGSLSASIDTTGTNGPRAIDLKFSVPFQGGLDGIDPGTVVNTGEYLTGTNAFGMDLSATTKAGYKGYKKALDLLSNQDEYDINMVVLPGVVKNLHSSVTDAATVMSEDRGDTFYVMDLSVESANVNQAVADADGLDSNYAAVYYPWVKVMDTSRNKPIFVPPSVIVPAAIAASDRIGAEWFAPAGLNRGVLGTVIEAKNRLTQAERDELYEGRVNPIATFPATGVCIWGQKTLQVRPTALDRINVRRLLITLKKFIASSSKFLVFEQNTIQTRNRFLNIVNPYLESVQQRQGLYAFRVVMDETNNTPTEIDRNRLIGAIYLQPTKTAEFIVLDFNVLPTGATFGD